MPKRRLHHLILLLTLIFGPVAPAWAGMGSEEAVPRPPLTSPVSLHPFVNQSFKQVGLVEVAGAILAPEVVIPLLLSQPVVWGGVAYSAYAIGKQVYDVHNGDQDRIHYGTMALDAVGLIPLAGVVAKSVRAGWMGSRSASTATSNELITSTNGAMEINRLNPERLSDQALQGLVDHLTFVGYGSHKRAFQSNVLALTEKDGILVVSKNSGAPNYKVVNRLKEIFGDIDIVDDIIIISKNKSTNHPSWVTGNHAELRGLHNSPFNISGSRQAISHYSCNGCAEFLKINNVRNITGSKMIEGQGRTIQRLTLIEE